MATSILYNQTVSANVPAYAIIGGGSTGEDMLAIAIKMKTNAPESSPGQGQLLCTIEYFNGEQLEQVLLSLQLAAGGFSYKLEPFIWHDLSQDVTLAFQYIGPGGADGTCDVKIVLVDL